VLAGKKTLEAEKLIKGLVLPASRLCVRIKTLKLSKQHEGQLK
jgi:hypothetical protein